MGKIFKQYYTRLAKEGFLKALLCGLIVGFSALFIAATVFWFVLNPFLWVSIPVAVVVAVAATPIFYYAKFRPSTKAIARRIDELGLEERILTMTQLEGDTSYIALKQREDAQRALSSVNANLLKIAISVPLVVAVSIVAVFSVGMTTAYALSGTSGQEIIDNIKHETLPDYEVFYDVDGEGSIVGEDFQMVTQGDDATTVMAVAEPEWAFVEWSDGLKDPVRTDLNITENKTIIAIFAETEDGEEGDDGEGDGEEGEGEEGEGRPEEGEGKGDGDSDEPSDQPSESAGGSRSDDANQIVDGGTWYGDEAGAAGEESMNQMQQGDYPSDAEGIVVGYLGTISTGTP